jgi:hypothetical protein
MSGAPADYDVFLSYSRADEAAANALRDRLVDDGKFQVFIDWRALLAGRPWQPALEWSSCSAPSASPAGSIGRYSSASTARRVRIRRALLSR